MAERVELTGRRVRVWWPLDGAFYTGTITAFSSRRGHQVKYDHVQGEADLTEWTELADNTWEFEAAQRANASSAQDGSTPTAPTPSAPAARAKRKVTNETTRH